MPLRKPPPYPEFAAASLPTLCRELSFRDQRELMERPFFSLSKNPRFDSLEYHLGDVSIVVKPSKDRGLATIWDADILIWAATQIINSKDAGKPFNRQISFHPRAMLREIGRYDGRSDYHRLEEALERLHETSIKTTIRADKRHRSAAFHWIDDWDRDTNPRNDRSSQCSLTLSKWVFRGIIQQGGVLSINRNYFLLTGGLERWLYRIARKHGGNQSQGWSMTMSQLYQKSGSQQPRKNFSIQIRTIVKSNIIPDYRLSLITPLGGEETLLIVPKLPELPPTQTIFEFP